VEQNFSTMIMKSYVRLMQFKLTHLSMVKKDMNEMEIQVQ